MTNTQSKNKKHLVIFSHGSGVRKDDRGLLSEIAEALPEVQAILFDYYQIDEVNKTLTMTSFSAQTRLLNQVIDKAKQEYPGATIDIIAHSQGTIVAALAQAQGIRKTLLLSAVFDMDLERTLKRYRSRPEADINLSGISKLPPLDGLVRIVPAQYWTERVAIKPFLEYNTFAKKTDLIIINAQQDQILGPVDLSGLDSDIKIMSLTGNHGFEGKDRKPLIETIRKILFS